MALPTTRGEPEKAGGRKKQGMFRNRPAWLGYRVEGVLGRH